MCRTILTNGRIYTVDGLGWENAPAEAMAIGDDGKIIAVGSNREIIPLGTAGSEIMDLCGKTVLPGFIDSHVHMPGTAFTDLFQINLFGCVTKEETLSVISDYIKSHPNEDVYFGTGFNMGMVDADGIHPNALWLDEICKDRPIVLRSYDMHSNWLNTCAMKVSGIDENTKEPEMGRIHKNDDGSLTGLFTDCPNIGIIRAQYSHKQEIEAVKYFLNRMSRWGYTSISSVAPHTNTSPYIYKEIEAEGALNLRVNAAQFISHSSSEEDLKKLIEMGNDLETDLIKAKTAKFLIDGVLEGWTAYLKEPYDEAAGLGENYNSIPEWTQTELEETFDAVMENGFQIHCHSVGDGATTLILDALESINKTKDVRKFRNILTHLQVVSPGDISRMEKLNIIAALQTFWHFKEPGFFETVDLPALGKDRVEKEYPAKSFVNAGVKITNSGDYPVSAINDPILGIKAGIMRNLYSEELFGIKLENMDDEKFLLGKEERLSLTEMIEAYTINGAYQMFRENEIGSLATGKMADYVVLSEDPFEMRPEKIDDMCVIRTVIGGKTAYKA